MTKQDQYLFDELQKKATLPIAHLSEFLAMMRLERANHPNKDFGQIYKATKDTFSYTRGLNYQECLQLDRFFINTIYQIGQEAQRRQELFKFKEEVEETKWQELKKKCWQYCPLKVQDLLRSVWRRLSS